jgi:two-component system, response regulator FlrC
MISALFVGATEKVSALMSTLHFLTPTEADLALLLDRLADLMARRRIAVTRGGTDLAHGAAALVGCVVTAAQEHALVQMARMSKIRSVFILQMGAERLAVTPEMGGSLTRISLPLAETETNTPLAETLLSYAADVIAQPIRPMVACDPATGGLIDLAARVAATDVTVMINGPTGSGKEVLARAIHAASPRAPKPFIAINCAAIPENMLEAMLFGHVKGAFTGAITAGQGLIRAADGGTLLLDEISEMPLGLQAKLLRVLQERKVTPLGASEEVAVDLRVLATSNRDMRAEVAAGRFREDLYYRLNVFPLYTLALEERPEDIVPLAIAFLRRHAPAGILPLFSAKALDVLRFHAWPGNVRELENVVQRALVLCDGQHIDLADILFDQLAPKPRPAPTPAPTAFKRPRAAAI